MSTTIYPTLEEVRVLHSLLLARYGGEPGVRDLGMLDAALHRPRSGYYASLSEQAAALLQSLANRGFVERVESDLPKAKFVALASPREFFEQANEGIDVMVFSAETGIGVDARLREFVNHWIEIRRRDGTLERLYNHWILARSPETESQRWSVIRDVLHWVE